MIIEMLLDLMYRIFSLLTSMINLPSLPDGLNDLFLTFSTLLVDGYCILSNYVDMLYLMSLLGIVIAVDIGINIYKFVMWIIKKIPMLSVS